MHDYSIIRSKFSKEGINKKIVNTYGAELIGMERENKEMKLLGRIKLLNNFKSKDHTNQNWCLILGF